MHQDTSMCKNTYIGSHSHTSSHTPDTLSQSLTFTHTLTHRQSQKHTHTKPHSHSQTHSRDTQTQTQTKTHTDSAKLNTQTLTLNAPKTQKHKQILFFTKTTTVNSKYAREFETNSSPQKIHGTKRNLETVGLKIAFYPSIGTNE